MSDETRWEDWFVVTQAWDGAHLAERRLAQAELSREIAQMERLVQSLSRAGSPTG